MRQKSLLKTMLLLCALIVGSGSAWAETKTEGFETATAGTTYNSTQTYTSNNSDCGIGWTMYYGTVSTNVPISKSKSAQMRWYSSASNNYPYIKTTTTIDNLSKVEFKAKVGNTNVKMDVDYSTNGSDWSSVVSGVTFTTASTTENFSYDIPSGGKYIKIGVSKSSTAPTSGNYIFVVDDVVFTYTLSTYTVTFDAGDGTFVGNTDFANTSNTEVTAGNHTLPSATPPTGYIFDGWIATGITTPVTGTYNVTANIEFTASYSVAYTVTFDAGDGTFVGNTDFANTSNTEVTAGNHTLPSATPPTGYIFDGWIATGITTPVTGTYNVTANIDFTASYSVDNSHEYNFAGANNFYTDTEKTTHPSSGSSNNVGTIYYSDGSTFVASGTNRYFSDNNSGYFLLGKTGAEISLPTFSGFKITQVKIHSSTGHSTSVAVSIVSGSNIASNAQTWSTKDHDYVYDISSDYQSSSLSVKVTNNYNSQFTSITLVCEQLSNDPIINVTAPEALAYNASEGEFGYSITNPTSATLSAASNSDWITNVAVDATNSKVTFRTSTNPNTTQRTGTITLSYAGATDKVVTITQAAAPLPEISADNVNIAYDATGGNIAYTISNQASGTLTASVTQGSWITLNDDFTNPIAFTCDANTAAADRTATVTLTYTYNTNETVSKEVTVTQAGNPDAFDPISSISEPNTEHIVRGTVVAINARGFVIGDGTGYVYTYLNATPSQSVGDKVSITGTTGTYGHILQFTNTATIKKVTSSNYDNAPAATVITSVPDYSTGYHLSTYLQFEGNLTKSNDNYYISVGGTEIQISYPTTTQGNDLGNLKNKTVLVKGYFSGINSSSKFTVMMESVEEIIIPKLSIDPTTVDPFEYEENENRSDEAVITVTGENLTSTDITVTVTGDYELRPNSGSYNNLTSLTLSSGDTFGVNLKENLTEGEHNGTLTIASEGATSIVINLTGTVTPYVAPAIEATQTTVNVGAADGDGTISITYTKIDTDLVDVKFYESNGTTPATYDWIDAEIDSENNNLYYTFGANTGEARTAYLKVYGVDNKGGDSYIYSELIAITQAKYEFPGSWVAADLADINANDVFVIVGDNGSTYAMTNNNSTSKAPDVVEVTVIDNTLSGTIADNIKWNVTYDTKNEGYIFNPNGSTNTWLYCTNTNNGVRVGTGDAKHFNLSGGYLTTTETTDQRYIGIYNSQDWRCYDNKSGNIANQTFTFYKKLAAKLNAYGYATFSATVPVDFSLADGFSAWAITAISGTSITFSQITGAVPENTGVLLKGAAGETVYLAATASGTEPSSNLLEAITTATSIEDGKYYGLKNNAFVPVSAGTIPAGKALLPASKVTSGARLTFVFEEANGISAVESVKTMAEGYYNLQGQRIDTPKKGLYIVNGKKVIIK